MRVKIVYSHWVLIAILGPVHENDTALDYVEASTASPRRHKTEGWEI